MLLQDQLALCQVEHTPFSLISCSSLIRGQGRTGASLDSLMQV